MAYVGDSRGVDLLVREEEVPSDIRERPLRKPEDGGLPRIALHVCCGPCASAVVERLREGFVVEALWYNPNIQPQEEHDRRLASMRKLAREIELPLTVLPYEPHEWEQACLGRMGDPEGGERCLICYELRLRATAQFAAAEGIETIATTLTVSPYKPAARVNPIGRRVAAAYGLTFLDEDFKKRDGFLRSVQLSKQYDLYRQTYCGCLPSRRQGGTG